MEMDWRLTPHPRDLATPLPISDRGAQDGALMEQSGCNQCQPVANGAGPKTSQTSQNRCHRLPLIACTSLWQRGGRLRSLRNPPRRASEHALELVGRGCYVE